MVDDAILLDGVVVLMDVAPKMYETEIFTFIAVFTILYNVSETLATV